MSYCVNCGVELAPSQRACPLCGTPVQNPRQPYDPETPKPFPSELDLFSPSDDRGYLALIATLLLALPAAICLCCDLAYTHGAGWSLLVAGAMGLLWILVVPMLLIRRGRVWWALLLDTAGVLGYLWLVERFAAPGEWYWRLAVPIVLLLFFLAAADTLLLRRVVKGRLRFLCCWRGSRQRWTFIWTGRWIFSGRCWYPCPVCCWRCYCWCWTAAAGSRRKCANGCTGELHWRGSPEKHLVIPVE